MGEYRLKLAVLLVIALSVLAYAPAITLPFIADDYVQIALGQRFGPPSGWAELFADPLYRCRSTSLVLSWMTHELFGMEPVAYNLSSLILHIACALLILALGFWPAIGWRWSSVAAMFFAVYEGHQEAVIWYAAIPELLVCLFILASLIAWLKWLRGGGAVWMAASAASFALALLSKESAVILAAILPLATFVERRSWRPALIAALPLAAAGIGYWAWSFTERTVHLHYNDGTFSLGAPVARTMLNSTGRLLWFWGAIAVAALVALRPRWWKPLLATAFVSIAIALAPYSFLTYMPRVPSRHTYLASIALSIVVAAGLREMASRLRLRWQWAPAALASAVILHNCGYLWIRKVPQFVERAAPTEELIELARHVRGPVFVECFPYGPEIAWRALLMRLGKPPAEVFFPPLATLMPTAQYCYQGPLGPRPTSASGVVSLE
jgi:hypothetical protein